MSATLVYKTWEVGSHAFPPSPLVKIMQPAEQLLWAAEVPISRFLKRWIWLSVIASAITVLFIYEAPWGQTMAEYCGTSQGRSCRKFYLLAWPGVLIFAYLAILGLFMFWKGKSSPWVNHCGISTAHAIFINGNKPEKVHRTKLDLPSARIDWFDAVRFDRSTSGLSFVTLDVSDAKRAVYWANEGRFRGEFQEGRTP